MADVLDGAADVVIGTMMNKTGRYGLTPGELLSVAKVALIGALDQALDLCTTTFPPLTICVPSCVPPPSGLTRVCAGAAAQG
eukprot:COSAG01_NODE_3860_length_5618_cov_2.958869_2_plen_82_part_00